MILRLFLDENTLVYTTSNNYSETLKNLGLKYLGAAVGMNIYITDSPNAVTAQSYLKALGVKKDA